jgi:hypothetical protein
VTCSLSQPAGELGLVAHAEEHVEEEHAQGEDVGRLGGDVVRGEVEQRAAHTGGGADGGLRDAQIKVTQRLRGGGGWVGVARGCS